MAKADRLADLRAWARAEPFFIEAERGFTQAGDSRNALLAKLGRMRGELPRRSITEVSQELADILESPLATTDDRIRLRCLVIKGETDEDYDALLAEQDWREALAVAKRLNDELWMNRANGELGLVAALQGKTSEGLFLLASSLKKAEAAKDLSSVVRWLSIIGSGFIQFGRPEEALKYFDRALAAGSAVDELRYPLIAYSGKVSALTKLGRTKEARELLATTIAVARERESLGYQAELLREDALLAEGDGLREEAVKKLREALEFAQQANANRIVAQIYHDLGRLQIALGRNREANDAFSAGVEVARSMRERLLTPRLLAKFAESERAQGQIENARALLQEASEITEGLLAGVWSPWVKSRLVGIMDEVFLARVRAEVSMGLNPERLLPIIEQARGRAVTDLLMGRGQGEKAKTMPAKEGERRISTLQSRLWSAKGPAARQKLLDQIFQAESDMMAVSVQADRDRQFQGKRNPLRLAELRQSLRPDEMLLEYVLDDPTSLLLVVTRERAVIQKLPSRTLLKKSVDDAWKAIQAGQEVAGSTPLAELVRIPGMESKSLLVVVPDGDLNRLPFELLTTTAGSKLLQSHAVSYSPSATALYLIRRQTQPVLAKAVLAIAASPESQTASTKSEFGKVGRGIYDVDGASLPSLPAARAEAKLTVDTLADAGNRLLVGGDATESAIKALPLRDFAVAHFAAHGLLSSSFPERSALALRPEGMDDGFLQAREVLGLRMRAKLVTLSACNTGSGKLFGQDGVSSLVRPFLASGARAVVANLWTADDTFSLALMKEFYQELSRGKTKAVALQQAKLTMIRQYGKTATPKLWSGFILFGEGSEPVRASK
ncbi:MAG: CHAT domain-containing protein [Acidobacteria bacterium]|nr:CHAT domain-containing protein [Acidobacteriota bacterium]